MKRFTSLSCLLLCCVSATCATVADTLSASRPVSSTVAIEVGGGAAVDTYLSPLRYSGIHMALAGRWSKDLPFGHNLSMSFDGRMEGMRLLNPARNATEWQGAIGFGWIMQRRWSVGSRLTLAAGGGAGLYLGALYISRNANNPVAAKCQLGLTGALSASWKTQLGKVPLTVSDHMVSPVATLLFSQDYGQPYYNIYLGNRGSLVHGGWWGNNFCIDNLLCVSFGLKKGDMGIGYRLRYYSSHVCNLDTRILTHAAVISWTPRRK